MSPSSRTSRAIEQLSRSALFAGLSEQDLTAVRPVPEIICLTAGQTLMRQGDMDTDYYVLVKGRLSVVVRDGQGAIIARGRVVPGEGVGEMALMMNEPRSATVNATVDSELVRFTQENFLKLVETHPRTMMAIALLTMRRLKEQYTTRHQDAFRAIAIVPLEPDVDSAGLARELALQLSSFGRSTRVEPGFSGLDFSSAPDIEQGAKLAQLEHENRFTVYSCSGGMDGWSRHCAQTADLVLLCVGAASEPEPGLKIIPPLQGVRPDLLGRLDLIIVHGSEWNRACRTQNWIVRTAPAEFHHIRAGNRKDVSRLARIISGQAVNLVLSGGGAKSFSQIGALQAFAKAGIPIDRAAGSSMGAYVSAIYCYDGDLQALAVRTRDEIRQRRPTRDFTLPLLSLLTGRRLNAVASAICPDWRIEDLPLRYFCVSADLGQAGVVEHFDGSLCEALHASCALPGFAPPLLSKGRLLADGGILNNLPIDLMHRHFSGSIIAVDVAAYGTLQLPSKYELQSPSGFELLWDKINPFGKREPIPNIFDVLFRSATLSSELHGKRWGELAQLTVIPPVKEFKVTDFDRFDDFVEIGYRHTMEKLEAAEKDPVLKCKLWPGQVARE
jgi:predicted acylesterase/phospholipase RssA